jgi:hypothetical protein
MSYFLSLIILCFWGVLIALLSVLTVSGQPVTARISIDAATGKAMVSGSFDGAGSVRVLAFEPSAVGAPKLAERVSGVHAFDKAGAKIELERAGASELRSGGDIAKFEYEVDLAPGADWRSAGHASWIARGRGVLFLDDLLPLSRGQREAEVTIEPPTGWTLATSAAGKGAGTYSIADRRRAVFILGSSIRVVNLGEGLTLVTEGGRHFMDAEAAEMALEVFDHYRRMFGRPVERPLVALLSFPQQGIPAGSWEAETRGTTSVIVSADMAFRTQSLQRLHEQLRHEIFHFWLPNGVDLTGAYDWFFEGFALYQSLKLGVAVNRIRFDDLLQTLSRANDINRSDARAVSLWRLSEDRWRGAESLVYARGMLTAFASDLALLNGSKGKRSTDTLLKEVYTRHKHPAPAKAGNTAVLEVMSAEPSLAPVGRDLVDREGPVDISAYLEMAGLETDAAARSTEFRVKPKLSGGQKSILDRLGYNNWRKLMPK